MRYSVFVCCFILYLFFHIPADAKKSTFNNRAWTKIPTIVIVGSDQDPRYDATFEAVDFWNSTLSDIGTPFRLGSITHNEEVIPDENYITRLSAHILEGKRKPKMPENYKKIPEDLIIVFSSSDIISFSSLHPSEGKVIIGMRSYKIIPLTLPNVTRNLIAHELGHAIGLGHNDDPTKLMCGRPAPCRPVIFQSDEAKFFPLTDQEKLQILKMYPSDWKE
jgi:hypothetical protein